MPTENTRQADNSRTMRRSTASPCATRLYFAIPKAGFLHAATMRAALGPCIRDIHREWGIDAVNCHWLFPDGAAAQRVCARLGIPVMLTALGCDLNEYPGYMLRRQVIRRALREADRVSVLNQEMRGACLALGVDGSRLTVIPNGVDTRAFSILHRAASRKTLDIPEQGRLILFVGSLDPVKSVDTLIRAFAALRRAREGSERLIIAGRGYLESQLKRLSAEVGAAAAISFVGAVEHRALPLWMNAADCLCLPSLREGHPNVMMEALACGTPVVGSHVGSIPEFVDESAGFSFRPGDHDDLAAKLGLCLGTSYNRESIRARVANHTWKRCAERYAEEIARVVRRA